MSEPESPHSRICRTPWRSAQLVEKRKKPRFDKARKRIFLEWFAATCNVRLAARQVGISQATAYRNRMSDPDFAEAWDRALEQGYARLEAKLLEMQFEAVEEPLEFDPGFDPELDFPDQKLVDPDTAIALLRQHRGSTGKGRVTRQAAGRIASDEEVRLALAKRLRAFAVRVTNEDMKGDGVSLDLPRLAAPAPLSPTNSDSDD
jgi:hypothetical protein